MQQKRFIIIPYKLELFSFIGFLKGSHLYKTVSSSYRGQIVQMHFIWLEATRNIIFSIWDVIDFLLIDLLIEQLYFVTSDKYR